MTTTETVQDLKRSAASNGAVESDAKKQKTDETKPVVNIYNLPSPDDVGIDQDLFQLCATLSGSIYDKTSTKNFQELLLNIPEIQENFSDLQVRFLEQGVTVGTHIPEQLSTNPPSFTGVITGDTLILAWRGTTTLLDILADMNFDSESLDSPLNGVEVQETYHDIIQKHLENHEKDILNYVSGNYMVDKNKPLSSNPDGKAVKRIILTGHSLGGGLAQVAHLFLTSPVQNENSPYYELADKVDVITVAFSAPMTTALTDELNEASKQHIEKYVQPKMCNVLFNADVVPRGYAHLRFIDDFLEALKEDDKTDLDLSDTVLKLAESFIQFGHKVISSKDDWITQLKKYHHVGKLVYYEDATSKPQIQSEDDFYELKYGPQTDVAQTAYDNHLVLVNGPGLAFAEAAEATE